MSLFKTKIPSKSRSLKEIRKVYPAAEIAPHTDEGRSGVQLTYGITRIENGRKITERAPVLQIMNGPGQNLNKDALAYACVVGAFRQLGYTTHYTPGFPSGRFDYEPVKDFPRIPKEIADQNLTGKELADAMNAHVRAREAELQNNPAGPAKETPHEQQAKTED